MKSFWRPLFTGAVILAVGLAAATAAALWQQHYNHLEAEQAFDALSRGVATQVAARMGSYERGLRGARGVVLAADGTRVWREPYKRYSDSRDIDQEFPGARGFGIIWRVAEADEAAFVARGRADGWPDFAVRQIEPHAGERFVIQYIEPVQRNRQAVGLDIASEPTRRAAALASMRSGAATLTSPITLVQAAGKPQQSFLLMLPIYRPGAATDTAEQRESAAIGWSYAPLVIDEVLQNLDRQADHYTLSLRDVNGADTRSFYRSPGSDAPVAAGLQQLRGIDIFGRTWQADLRATPAFVASLAQTSPRTVALVVALIGALSAAMVALRMRLTVRLEAQRVEQARRAAIVDASNDAIIGESLDGIVTDWNTGAERLFGYSASEALGRSVTSLVLPDDRRPEDTAIRSTIAGGQRITPFDTTRRHRDGSLIEVSISASPIMTADGRCIGLAKTVRDIRQARMAQRALAESNTRLESQVAERTARLDTALHDLRAILDAVPSMIGYWDHRLVNRVANRAYSDWFGVDPQDLQGKTLHDLLGEELFERSRPFIEAALRGEPQTFERSTPQRSGSGSGMRHSLVHYLPDMVGDDVRGFYALVHDVTDLVEGRRRLAIAERENAALLGTLHQHALVSVADRHGRIIEVNDSFCALSGYDRNELIGQDHRILNSGHHEPAFWIDMWRTIAGGAAWRAEVCNRAKDGSLYWVNSIVTPFIGADGRIEKYISIRNDITAAKLTEQRLRSSEAFLDRAGRIAGVGGWEIDLATRQVHWSAQTYRIHEVEPGYSPNLSEAVDFYPPQARQVIERAVADGIAFGKPWDLELPLITAKGRSIWVRAVGAAEREEGKVVRLAGAFQDITARKEAEATLARERQLMNSLLDTLPDQIYFKDRDSRFLRINPALARRFGLTDPVDGIGKSDADFFAESHAQRTTQIEQQIVTTAKPVVDLEEQELWPDRAPTWNLTTRMPLYDEHGRVIGTFGISRDITHRKRIEEELQRTNTRFSLAADSVGLGVWEFDVVAGTLVWDERMYQLYGCESSGGAEPYTLWSHHLHPEDRARSEGELQDAIAGLRAFDTTFRIVLPNGAMRHLKASAHVVRDIEGRALRMTGVNFDVSERVEAEFALQQRERMMRLVIDSFPGPLAHWDAQMRCTFANQAYQGWMGLDPGQMIGRTQRELFGDEVFSLNKAYMEAALRGEPQRIEREREFADGTPRSYLLHYVPDHDGQDVRGFISVVLDISPLKAVEKQLRQTMHRANEANRAKSQFLANMSHEIRTPMNAVIGLSYLLERTSLDANQAGMLSKIKVASKALLGIINDVLDLSKIEAGEMQVEHAAFSLPGLLRDLSELMSMQAQAKGIAFSIDAPADLPQALQGDATRLQQVLTNLLSNAIKFTAQGSVQLRVLCVQATPASVRLRFVAKDTGIGIAPDALERLFAPFVQADTSTTRRFGGTGLGLSIVKQLVTLMKGEIGVSSEPGVGSEFWAEVPFLVGETALVEVDFGVVAGPGLQGVRVLIVDDSDINLEVAKNILQLEGARVSLAANGLQAVEYLQAHEAEIDIVLMDVQMPVLDGLEATRRIRSKLGLAELPIIGLTAGISNEEHQSAEAAGMNDVIGKPFDPRGLVRRMRRHVGMGERVPDAVRPERTTQVPETWPLIEGIDACDAAMRLGGDVALFGSMLKRLLRDFAGFEFDDTEAHALQTLASRMHSLKGSAGTLGAKDIERLASQAETACRANDGAQAAPLARRIAQELQVLRQHAEPVLAGLAAAAKPDNSVAPPTLDAQAVAELLQQLRRAELGAMDRFAEISAQLRGRLKNDTYQLLSEQIDNLQFDEALQTLEAHL